MGVAATSTDATMSAIQDRLIQLNVMLGRIAARQDKMLVDLKKTAALTPTTTTTPTFVAGRVLEQQTTKASSTLLFSAVQAVGAGAPHADAVIASAMPTRCLTKGPGHYIDISHSELVFPASDTTHLPATTSSGVGNYTLQGVAGAGRNTDAGCSTHVRTWRLDVPGAPACNVDVNMTRGPDCQVEEQPAVRCSLLPQISFPRFNGDNPQLWRDKCLEYFKIFNISECIWVTAATLYMEGAAAHWYKEYKLSQPVGDWSQFISAVEAKFDAGDFSQMLGNHVVELSSSSSSSMAVVPGLQDADVYVLQPETLVVEATHSVCEEVLVVSEDKTNMDCAVRQTYNEICDDVITHVGSVSLFRELGLSFGEDLCTKRISKDMASDEELAGTVLTHVGDWSLFTEHDMDTCPEFQLLVSRLHSSWDPGGSTVAQLALNSTPFAGHNIVYSKKNLLMDLMGWEDNKAVILAVELYVQWDPGIMTIFLSNTMVSMDELS